ncbi:MAG: 2-oxo acid dehydrogenase subunit E2 [Actinomycetota bacterium]|nr:2-oxo acid dehydrogenase subunit E2 [Actinomycetota bacterium]
MTDVTMPQLGETVTEGTITRWFKQVGDKVAADEALFEVSTDKVDSEVPAPAAGYLAEIRVVEGDTVDVGATLAVLSDEPPGGGGGAGGAQEAEAPADEAPVAPDESGSGEGRSEEAEQARAMSPSPSPSPGNGGGGDGAGPSAAPLDKAAAPSRAASDDGGGGPDSGGPRLLSPVVRRLVAENGLDAGAIAGTGAGGRITRNDVLAVIQAGDGRTAPRSSPAPSPRSSAPPTPARAPATGTSPGGEGDEVVPFSNMRRRTAEHMIRSKATSAHTLVVLEVDYEGVDRVRLAAKDRFKAEEGVNLTYLPFVSRAVVDALREFPQMNASVGDDQLVVHRSVHLGIAVDLHFEGLMVPVVHGADGKRLRVLAREIAALAAQARDRKLGPDDIAGGTFTITNPGPFGTLVTGAIINQPQVAILSTDGVRKRPVVIELPDGSDAIAVHPVGNLALTFDHRAVDGAYASAFVAKVAEILQSRDWAAELA